jgi:hypothetical protein
MCPKLTFGDSAASTVADELGLRENEDGILEDKETGKVETAIGTDEQLTLDSYGGSAKGSRVSVSDDYNSVSEYVEQRLSDE